MIGAAIGSVVGGLAQASAAKKGAEVQAQAARESNELQREIYYNNVDLMKPWHTAGTNALAQMQYELGLTNSPAAAAANALSIEEVTNTTTPAGSDVPWAVRLAGTDKDSYERTALRRSRRLGADPAATTSFKVGDETFDTRDAAQAYINDQTAAQPQSAAQPAGDPYANFRNTPGYQFQLEEGQRALDQAAAAKGMRFSSDTLKGFQDFGQGLADQTYGTYWNRLAAMGGGGQTAANTTAGYGQNYANAVNQNNMRSAQAQASGYQKSANAVTGTMNSLTGIWAGANAGLFGDNPWSFGFGG